MILEYLQIIYGVWLWVMLGLRGAEIAIQAGAQHEITVGDIIIILVTAPFLLVAAMTEFKKWPNFNRVIWRKRK